jgi:hypothetical protein
MQLLKVVTMYTVKLDTGIEGPELQVMSDKGIIEVL